MIDIVTKLCELESVLRQIVWRNMKKQTRLLPETFSVHSIDAMVKRDRKQRIKELQKSIPTWLARWYLSLCDHPNDSPNPIYDGIALVQLAIYSSIVMGYLTVGMITSFWSVLILLVFSGLQGTAWFSEDSDDENGLGAWLLCFTVSLFFFLLMPILRFAVLPHWFLLFAYKKHALDPDSLGRRITELEGLKRNAIDIQNELPALLEARINTAETEVLHAEGPFICMHANMLKRLSGVEALGQQLKARRMTAEENRHAALDEAILEQTRLVAELRAARDKHEKLIAAARAAFAECRAQISEITGAVGDAKLIQQLAKEKDEAGRELELADACLQETAGHLYSRVTSLRALIGSSLTEPSAQLFISSSGSLEEDLRRYENLAEIINGGLEMTKPNI
ncbi:hypothetical protein KBC54_03250 [Patescibacteria group bacterium]|nr:hypothetical protein [Patescibacteria group bacterium]